MRIEEKCCLLLGMYLTDHPELELNTSINNTSDGERYVTVCITRKSESEVSKEEARSKKAARPKKKESDSSSWDNVTSDPFAGEGW